MTITYPLSMPTTPGIKKFRMTARDVVAAPESPFTGGELVYDWQADWWEAEITLPPMQRAAAEEWVTFLLSLYGKKGTFLLGDPDATTPRGVATGTPLVKGASQSGIYLLTDGWTPSTTNILKKGDYVQIGSGSSARLHKNLEDVTSDASGNATLTLFPRLRQYPAAPADNAAITVSAAKGVFRLASNERSWDTDEACLFGITFAAREAMIS